MQEGNPVAVAEDLLIIYKVSTLKRAEKDAEDKGGIQLLPFTLVH